MNGHSLLGVIAELQIEPNEKHKLENLEGSVFMYFFVCGLFVCCNAWLTLMLLWPLKKPKGKHYFLADNMKIPIFTIFLELKYFFLKKRNPFAWPRGQNWSK